MDSKRRTAGIVRIAVRQRMGLDKLGWTEEALGRRAKGEPRKVQTAGRPGAETCVPLLWIAEQLAMGAWTHVAHRLNQTKMNQ